MTEEKYYITIRAYHSRYCIDKDGELDTNYYLTYNPDRAMDFKTAEEARTFLNSYLIKHYKDFLNAGYGTCRDKYSFFINYIKLKRGDEYPDGIKIIKEHEYEIHQFNFPSHGFDRVLPRLVDCQSLNENQVRTIIDNKNGVLYIADSPNKRMLNKIIDNEKSL